MAMVVQIKGDKIGSRDWRVAKTPWSRSAAKVGRRMDVIVDEIDADGATCRTKGDAPEIDGNLFIDADFEDLSPGDIVGQPQFVSTGLPFCVTVLKDHDALR